MGHRHEVGEILFQVFVAQVNSDQTEGRGGMRDKDHFDNENDAYLAVKGQGVMGVGDGNVVLRSFVACGGPSRCAHISVYNKQIYNGSNYGRKPGENGWIPEFDKRKEDPDYQQYLALKKKFEE